MTESLEGQTLSARAHGVRPSIEVATVQFKTLWNLRTLKARRGDGANEGGCDRVPLCDLSSDSAAQKNLANDREYGQKPVEMRCEGAESLNP